MPSSPYTRVSLGNDSSGRPLVINQRTKDMLTAVEKKLGRKLTIIQGSYRGSAGAAASALTHARGGVVDIRTWDLGSASPATAVKVLRQYGFAAWYRTKAQGFDPHIHAVAIADRELHPEAAAQVEQYRHHQNGLANHGPDDGPRVAFITWEQAKLPRVSASQMHAAWLKDRHRATGLYPRQTMRVQAALGFAVRTGRWGKRTRSKFGPNGPSEATLKVLGHGRFRVVA